MSHTSDRLNFCYSLSHNREPESPPGFALNRDSSDDHRIAMEFQRFLTRDHRAFSNDQNFVANNQPYDEDASELCGATNTSELHPGVVCDSCDGPVFGYRYKCLTCPNTDLCSECERMRVHSHHNMMRISSSNRDSAATHAQMFLLRNATLSQKMGPPIHIRMPDDAPPKDMFKSFYDLTMDTPENIFENVPHLPSYDSLTTSAVSREGTDGRAQQIQSAIDDVSVSSSADASNDTATHDSNDLCLSSHKEDWCFMVAVNKEIPDDCHSSGSSSFELLAVE